MTRKFDRRSLLRGIVGGAAVSVGLPFLDCFLDDKGTVLAATGDELPVGFGTWFQALGLTPGRWVPDKIGANYENNVELKVFDPFHDRMNIISGTDLIRDLENGFAEDGYRLLDLMQRIASSREFYQASPPRTATASVTEQPAFLAKTDGGYEQ